jgi:hypothetical protein
MSDLMEISTSGFTLALTEAASEARKAERELILEVIDRVLIEQDQSPAIIVKTIQYLRHRIEIA